MAIVRAKSQSSVLTSRSGRKIDNPLLQSTLRSKAVSHLTTAAAKREERPAHISKMAPVKKAQGMSIDEEKISVFEIISDLERQLDAAFSMRDAQEEEIAKLKDALAKAESKFAVSDERNKELKGTLVSQEELSSELEFLENERLEAGEKLRFAEEDLKKSLAEKKSVENKAESLVRELDARSTRIEQIELELDSANKTIQSFQNQIALLEDEKEELLSKLDKTNADSSDMIMERDRAKRDLERAKESLDEIRLMLAETRAKTREQYYKKTAKK